MLRDLRFAPRCLRLTGCALALLVAYGSGSLAFGQPREVAQLTFADLLKELSSAPANPCDSNPGEYLSVLEFRLFLRADKAVAEGLNENADRGFAGEGPRARAIGALTELERLSAETNRTWPEEKRFHFEVLDLPPDLLVKMTYRNRATFSFFAYSRDDDSNRRVDRWHWVGALDEHKVTGGGGYDGLDLFPLNQSSAKRPRFLATFHFAGCGSGEGVSYYAYEWSPEPTGRLDEFIKLEGAVSRWDAAEGQKGSSTKPEDSFFPVGKLRTGSPVLSLPYCWYSAVDTWDNPNLCAVNSYDLSGDRARFVHRDFNRPELVQIAKAIEYAQARDYPATLAYCGSPDVARQMVRDIPPFVTGAVVLNITRVNASRKRIEINDQPTLKFDVEKRGDRWLVVAFRAD